MITNPQIKDKHIKLMRTLTKTRAALTEKLFLKVALLMTCGEMLGTERQKTEMETVMVDHRATKGQQITTQAAIHSQHGLRGDATPQQHQTPEQVVIINTIKMHLP